MKIKLFAMDVDGTLTDGRLYYGPDGECMKAFHVKDGQGIVNLKAEGVITAIITARYSKIVEQRSGELGVDEVLQSVKDKRSALQVLCEKYRFSPEETAYIGDDIGDLPALSFAGTAMVPADAVPAVLNAPGVHVMSSRGGEGAVREAAEWIINHNR